MLTMEEIVAIVFVLLQSLVFHDVLTVLTGLEVEPYYELEGNYKEEKKCYYNDGQHNRAKDA